MPRNEGIRMRYELRMEAEKQDRAEIMVYGEICSDGWKWVSSDVSANDFDKLLKEAKGKGAKSLTVRINSGGGEVYQAVAMRTMLMNCGMEVDVQIEGLCASAATLLCCVPGTRVTMSEGSEYMIHNPSGIIWGNAKDMESYAVTLRTLEKDFASIYEKRCGLDAEQIRAMMDEETWMNCETAKELGFVDEVLEGAESPAASAHMMDAMRRMYRNMPQNMAVKEVSPAPEGATENKEPEDKEEKNGMEIKNATPEMVMAENPELHSQIMQAGAQAERERIQDIDDLTPPGYEEMAQKAKAEGTSAMDYHKAVVKMQRQKGASYMEQRHEETAPAAKVEAGDPKDVDGDAEKNSIEANAKAVAQIAANLGALKLGGMM